MKRVVSYLCVLLLSTVLISALVVPVGAYDILDDPASQWIVGEEYGGQILFNSDGSISVFGNSGIVTYVGAKFMDSTVTVRFKTSISSQDGWAAIYICNDVDAELMRSADDGGGIRAFPWYGQGLPLSINIKNNRISLTNSYTDGLRSVNIMTEHGKYRFHDGEAEHTLVINTTKINESTVQFKITIDNGDTLLYTQRSSEELPMKRPGYLSFACSKPDEWLQILSVDVVDGLHPPSADEEETTSPTETSALTVQESDPEMTENPTAQPSILPIINDNGFIIIGIIVAVVLAAMYLICVILRKKKK